VWLEIASENTYHNKLLTIRVYMDAPPSFESLQPTPAHEELEKVKMIAHQAGYNLLVELFTRATKDKFLQICTSESLTAGLIMTTLVDIPWAGFLKYGCFGVYDTDAKRVFNHVKVNDVYTHRCAQEMAIGILKNSNATLAISVTGNAMPLQTHANRVGEVFMGVAGYRITKEGGTEIIYSTKSINACEETTNAQFRDSCDQWYSTIVKDHKYNPRDRTALMSQEIRYYAVYAALTYCLDFVKAYNPIVPDFILKRKEQNSMKSNSDQHTNIPPNKYDESIMIVCVDNDDECKVKNTAERVNTKTYHSPTLQVDDDDNKPSTSQDENSSVPRVVDGNKPSTSQGETSSVPQPMIGGNYRKTHRFVRRTGKSRKQKRKTSSKRY